MKVKIYETWAVLRVSPPLSFSPSRSYCFSLVLLQEETQRTMLLTQFFYLVFLLYCFGITIYSLFNMTTLKHDSLWKLNLLTCCRRGYNITFFYSPFLSRSTEGKKLKECALHTSSFCFYVFCPVGGAEYILYVFLFRIFRFGKIQFEKARHKGLKQNDGSNSVGIRFLWCQYLKASCVVCTLTHPLRFFFCSLFSQRSPIHHHVAMVMEISNLSALR